MATLTESQNLGERRGTGVTVHAPAFATTDDGHALIITSPRPILVATPDVQNDGAESITYELYRAQVSTADPDDDAWRLVTSADVVASETATVDELVNAHAIMLLIKSAAAGVISDGVVASLTGTA